MVVAYNRRDLLQEALDGLHAQSRPVAEIVVIDNASTDDSATIARAHPAGVDLVCLETNTGGAGGFAVGIARAIIEHEADLVWLMDDDTVPTRTALAELLEVRAALGERPTILGSRVVWTDGSDHPMNRPRRRLGAPSSPLEDEWDIVPVRSASFVSMLVDAEDVRASGLPVVDYFIWNDDFEFSSRLLRDGIGYYCNRSIVVHKTKALGSTDADPGDRFYFEVRNKVWLNRFSRPFAPIEGILYRLSTVRRWLRTYRRSSDRATISRAFRKGWRDGWAAPPRPNVEALSAAPTGSEIVRAFEASARSRL